MCVPSSRFVHHGFDDAESAKMLWRCSSAAVCACGGDRQRPPAALRAWTGAAAGAEEVAEGVVETLWGVCYREMKELERSLRSQQDGSDGHNAVSDELLLLHREAEAGLGHPPVALDAPRQGGDERAARRERRRGATPHGSGRPPTPPRGAPPS